MSGAEGAGDPPLISVVVPVLDGMPWLEHQLEALSTQDAPAEWEILVADNGSNDGSQSCVERWAASHRRIHLVDASARRGPAAARNIGVRAARGRLLAFCDADDVVRPGWLASLSASLDDADLIAGIFDFEALHGATGAGPVPAGTQQLGFLPFGLGANLATARPVFEAVGGFDESLTVGEDVDLCWRLQLAGYHFALDDDAVVDKREHAAGLPTFRAGWAYGRCGPQLYARYRHKGMRRDLRGAAKSWVWLVAALPTLFSPAQRQRWVRALGVRTGSLAGSISLGVFFP